MPSRYDGVIAITSMAAVGIGFLGGVIADTAAVAVPIAAIAFLLTRAALVLSRPAPPPQINTSAGQTRIVKGFR